MAVDTFANKPYGLRQLQVAAITGVGYTIGVYESLKASQELTFSVQNDSTQLRGDDIVQAIVKSNKRVDWSLSAGGISLSAYGVMTGGIVTAAGVSPAGTKLFEVFGASFGGYFNMRGRAVDAALGDMKVVIPYCKCTTEPGGTLRGEEFYITNASGTGIPHPTTDLVMSIQESETAAVYA